MTRRVPLVVFVVAALTGAGCGGGSGSGSRSQSASCDKVLLRKSIDHTRYATSISATGVDCKTAQEIAKQWGRQNTGGPTAKLPAGWKCGTIKDCRNGSARVAFELSYR